MTAIGTMLKFIRGGLSPLPSVVKGSYWDAKVESAEQVKPRIQTVKQLAVSRRSR